MPTATQSKSANGTAVTGEGAVGVRVRSLREAMDLSLRDLAERSGVSAPMLSQVERGDTSPTLAVAKKIAAGLDLTLSQLLRLDEDRHVVVVRAGNRRTRRRRGHRVEELTPPPPAGGGGEGWRTPPRRSPASEPTSRCTRWRRALRPGPPTTHRCTSPAA